MKDQQADWDRGQQQIDEGARAANRTRITEQNLARASIPKRFSEATLANFFPDNPDAEKVHSICEGYAGHFPEHKAGGQGMILCGTAGAGEDPPRLRHRQPDHPGHLASAVYVTASRAFRRVKDTYRRDSSTSEDEAIAAFVRPDLLILDEIGVQYGSATELNILFDIVNERYGRMLPTVLISNLALPKLIEYAGERVIDRMKENGGKLLVFDWKSHRGA